MVDSERFRLSGFDPRKARDDELIHAGKAGYTGNEMSELGGYLCDALLSEGYKNFNVVRVTAQLSGYKTTQKAWDLWRSDLKALGKHMAIAYIHEFVDVRKGIFK